MYCKINFKKCFKALLVSSMLLTVSEAVAVPAKPGKIVYELPDGEKIEVLLHGDESSHYYTTLDGYVLSRGDDGFFRYVTIDKSGENMVSDVMPTTQSKRTMKEKSFVDSIDRMATLKNVENMHKSRVERKINRKSMSKVSTYPTTGVQKGVAILVEFSNNTFTLENPHQQFYDQLNKRDYDESGATGSVKDYFVASSNGLFVPEFDVYGPVKLSKSLSYYGADSKTMTDEKAPEMIIEACTLLDSEIDFSQYDRDGDGLIDNVYVFYAGYGQADGGADYTVWPHSWDIIEAGRTFYFDGVRLGHYACSSELRDGKGSTISGIGVFCHEFSHVLGLPDLYATSYTGAFTPGAWSLMDSGSYNNNSWTPPYMSAYERYALNWTTPNVLVYPMNVTMKHITDEGGIRDAYMIKTNKENEYYILENRQQKGWDQYLPGHGMLVWHIDYNETIWEGNVVNNSPSHQYVDIVEADNDPSYYSIPGDAFPGTYNVTSFTDDTSPSMKTWAGVSLHSPVNDIKESEDGIVSFVFKGGVDIFGEITAYDATDIGADKVTLSWDTVSNASTYLVSIYQKTESGDKIFVGDYNYKDVGNVSSIEVLGLYPLNTYWYVVNATNGQFTSRPSNEVEFTTGEPTLNYKKVTVLPASDITDTGFTANWEKIEDADNYTITVYTSQLGEPEYEVLDFTGKLEALPSNWSTSCTGTYGLSSMCGTGTPSLKMDADGGYLQSPKYNGGLRTLSFWYRGSNAGANNVLKVQALNEDVWEDVYVISPINNTAGGTTVSFDIDRKYTSLKWVYSKPESGNVAIDDIKIGFGGKMEDLPIAGYTDIAVGDVDSYKIDGLVSGTLYAYGVQAHNSEFSSLHSDRVQVKPGEVNAIDDVNGEVSAICWTSQGKLTVNTSKPIRIVVTDCAGRVLLDKEQLEGLHSYDIHTNGVVIVKMDNVVRKLIL